MAYATPTDFANAGLPARATTNVPPAALQAALDNASGEMDGYFARYTLPLLVWGNDIKQRCCDIAAWICLKTRGFDPGSPTDNSIRVGYDDAIKWCERVSMQRINPVVTDSGSPPDTVSAPQITSNAPQGFGLLNGSVRRGTW